MIVNKEAIRKAFAEACESNCEFDALEQVAKQFGQTPEVAAAVVIAETV